MKKVLVTGANKGIGYEVVRQLAEQGFFVYLGSRDQKKGQAAVDQLRASGAANVEALTIDVASADSVTAAAAELMAKTDRLDVLINNAAISGSKPQELSAIDITQLKELFDTNFFGAIQTTQAMLPLLEKADQPVILNVSSELGSLTMQTSENRNPNWSNFYAYGSTKTAMNAFTILLAHEFKGSKFTVNSVTPGFTATDLNGFTGFKTPAQGAEPIVKAAIESAGGPTGKFFQAGGEVPW